ncbi:hypothetical protein TR631_33725 [Streptomyces rochei]|uniref:hypothetical protein n=1 Tax=Streptomyces rochei TaxID=1928 RepID=UPI002ACD648E|nr:hypothetical protein [Streptomyces rochei]WQC16523.1 hypothetical protein TR631_33725 [Streptomyces rochei]
MTPADELRTAARTLRSSAFIGVRYSTSAVAALLRARGPLANWLDLAAAVYDPAAEVQETDRSHEAALDVARAINGTAP